MQKENKFKGRMPDFKGSIDVVTWENTNNEGETYLSVVLGTRAKLVPFEKQKAEQGFEDIYE
ncbi:MAG: hypothetical protein KAR42_04675 [candidate division Zixibacteria bacterium]|nr:hypothetical protein [candidate division Zixibacteria bacterium]